MKKWLLSLSFILAISFLSGCDELDEVLGKINQILDQELEQQEDKEEESGTEGATDSGTETDEGGQDSKGEGNEDTEGKGTDNGTENTDDDASTYMDQIKSGKVEAYDLPNGFPFPIPEDWYLIQLHNDGVHPVSGDEYWEGSFYFESDDLPRAAYNFQNKLHAMGYDTDSESNYEGTPDYEYVMTYDGNEPGAGSGIVKFYYNEEDGACVAILYLTFE